MLNMRRVLAIAAGLLGAAVLSQFPEFVQQYIQRVGGAEQELRLITEDFRADATRSGLSEQEALTRFKNSNDKFLAERGGSMEETISRHTFLSEHYAALKDPAPFGSLRAFITKRDMPIAREAFDDFRPGVPFTVEGASHAGVGFVGGWLPIEFLGGILGLFGFGRSRKSRDESELEVFGPGE